MRGIWVMIRFVLLKVEVSKLLEIIFGDKRKMFYERLWHFPETFRIVGNVRPMLEL